MLGETPQVCRDRMRCHPIICIQKNHVLASSGPKSGIARLCQTFVFLPDIPHLWVTNRHLRDVVRRTIIYDQDLRRVALGDYTFNCLTQEMRLSVTGNDNGYCRCLLHDSNFVNVSSLQFAEESLRIHLSIALVYTSKWFKRNACKAKPFLISWQRCP